MNAPATTTATAARVARRPRRRPRDWVVDTLLFLAAVVFGLLVIGGRLGSSTMPAAWLFTADVAAGALGCAGLWLRRRWPVGLAVVLAVFSTFSEVVSGALVVATLTVAIHRPPRTTAAVFGLTMLTGLIFVVVRPEPGIPAWLLFMIGLAVQSAAVGWGLFIHFRRRLVLSLRDRATRAETEAQLRAEQAQQRARDEIAREMHDVLGHRLSLLSVHTGALEFRPDAPADEVARAAKVIRENAHQALQDLREVIGVLRAPVGELPQPTLADVRQLVAESGRAGMRVSLRDETGGPVPELAGRTAYRVVQEALTNARKHAPGAEVRVHLAGSPGAGLTVEVRNEAFPAAADHDPGPAGALHPDPPLPGPPVGERSPTTSSGPGVVHSPQPAVAPGQGLAGLAERVALADGRLEHGPTAEGGWRLSVWLPWPP
ncbi:MAG TPA: histidine kinase [Actinomycetes bacterium]|nr:histidine kinase [Actinomycetes bacterium]